MSIGEGCINVSMLTRKNLSNPIDISAETLLRHAKDVEANAKKAFAICTSENSPYKDFNGTFASGTTWENYIEWVRVEMFKMLEKDKVYEVFDEDDPDAMPQISIDGTNQEEDEGQKTDDSRNENEVEEDYLPEEDEDDDEEGSKAVEAVVINEDQDEVVPYDWSFKGFIVFALWGFIPIPGGEKYKSLLMSSIGGDEKVEGGTRKELRKMKTERSAIDRMLDKRGDRRNESSDIDNQLADLLSKGRLEMQRQKLFQFKVDQLEYQINFVERKMENIKDEIAMLDSDDVDEKKN